jgi:hypothetical protein
MQVCYGGKLAINWPLQVERFNFFQERTGLLTQLEFAAVAICSTIAAFCCRLPSIWLTAILTCSIYRSARRKSGLPD